jgi:protoporphyrinogen oxidase
VAGDTIVIGAGPAGLGAALGLGDGATLLERGEVPGGLCQSVIVEGAAFDLGGHSFHTPHAAIRELVFDAIKMEEQRREAWCFVAGELIPYPFQRNLAHLRNPALREACLAGLAAAGDGSRAGTFDRYIEERFGAGIARHFMRPYNEKLWGADLSRLAAGWTAERIAEPAGTSAPAPEGRRRSPLQGDTMVAYPAEGGFAEIYRALARRVPGLLYGQAVQRIDVRRGELVTQQDRRFAWKQLVSALPLPALIGMIEEVPQAIAADVARLVALPVNLVLLALTGRLENPMQRLYSPDPAITGHKFVFNHNSSAYLRALPRHGIQVEISGNRPEDDAALTELAADSVRKLGLLPAGIDIAASRVIRLPYGYPVPTLERASIVAQASAWLESRSIFTLGRFGAWDYINSDEALYRGLALGRRLAGVTPVFEPGHTKA